MKLTTHFHLVLRVIILGPFYGCNGTESCLVLYTDFLLSCCKLFIDMDPRRKTVSLAINDFESLDHAIHTV